MIVPIPLFYENVSSGWFNCLIEKIIRRLNTAVMASLVKKVFHSFGLIHCLISQLLLYNGIEHYSYSYSDSRSCSTWQTSRGIFLSHRFVCKLLAFHVTLHCAFIALSLPSNWLTAAVDVMIVQTTAAAELRPFFAVPIELRKDGIVTPRGICFGNARRI